MSYRQLVKKWERESKIRDKQERLARIERKETELKRADELFIAQIREEKKQKELYEQKMKEITTIKDSILIQLRDNNPFSYKRYLIVWDVLTGNYPQIESDVNNGRISELDITLVFQYISKFSDEIIDEYWKNKLNATVLY
jgi:hypothetical protein